jgi:hypothetical protein
MAQAFPFVMPNGRHKDVQITRVPVSYLKWMVGASHTYAKEAQAELDRRGTVTPEIEVSGHAIDRASLRIRKFWHQDRGQEEGLHAWLCRRGKEAYDLMRKEGREAGRVPYLNVMWIFEADGVWPVLKSVWGIRGH